MKRRAWPLALGLLYITAIAWFGGLRSDHVLVGLLPLLDSYNLKSRRFLVSFLPFIFVGVIYDSMRYYYWQGITGRIHIAEPYLRDLNYFGVSEGGTRLTLNEFFSRHSNVVLDLICGFASPLFTSANISRWLSIFRT